MAAEEPAGRTERPYLILTLRRTGGTHFMRLLQKVSAFPGVEHEPFNAGRAFGEITRRFRAGGAAAIDADLATALEARPNIKHCVEVVPLGLTAVLLDHAAARGYHVIVLTRQDEAARLRSLVVAQATQAWGRASAARIYPRVRSGETALPPADLRRLRQQYRKDAAAMGTVFRLLRTRGIAPDWITSEEIFLERNKREIFVRVATALGIADPEAAFEPEAGSGGGQGSGAIAALIPNIAEVEKVLSALPR